ncbi:MAG: hypothetical protein Q8T11_17610 [Elusimicrobiota bacterium]|nr:hypothetical protein [Elusimicrobiota bacterium]
MDDREGEKYLFLRVFSMDMDDVKNGIALLEKTKETDARFRIFRDLVVSYGRPFSTSRGKFIPKHTCPLRVVPKSQMELHLVLIALRNERFAHSDLVEYNPKLAQWKTKRGWAYPMSFKGTNYGILEKRLPGIKRLVTEVREQIQQEIQKVEAKFSELAEKQSGG